MFELQVETLVVAAHAIVIRGEREPVHGHHWHVTATVAGPRLDGDGLLCDFHLVERRLREIVAPFQNQSLSDVPPFNRTNPTAELFAVYIGERLIELLADDLPEDVRVTSLRVTEAPGCAAVWRP